MVREQRKLAAIVAADVVGYSRLMGRDESGTLARLRKNRSERLDPILTKYGGRLVKLTGDGALVEFGSAVDALSAAIEFQQAMAEANRDQPADTALVFRMGLHLGDLIVDGDDLYGDGVNVAARLEGEAQAGGILISGNVRDAVAGRLKATFEDLGGLSLKNIERPIQAFCVKWEPSDWQLPVPSEVNGAPATASPTPLPLPDKPSIAVLPFQNMSGDADEEDFIDGLVEDITTALARVSRFFVIARNSSFIYKGRPIDVRQIGRELGVRYVLEGSVRKSGKRLRITGQLIDTTTGNHVWADRFDGTVEDIFDMQDRMTSSVVGSIVPQLQLAEISRVRAKPTENLDAYDLYMRAAALVREFKEASHNRAVLLLERAVAMDPLYSSAYGFMSIVQLQRVQRNWGSFDEAKARGLEAARLALETGKNNPVSLSQAGFAIAILGGQAEEALVHLERALVLNPNAAMTWRLSGWVCWMAGNHERSIRNFERAIELSPMDEWVADAYMGIAFPYFFTGRYEDALTWIAKALPERPNSVSLLALAVAALRMAGRFTEEQGAIERLLAVLPRASIETVNSRIVCRKVDRDLLEAALRRAGLPE